jgi:hypothetical protein
LRTTRQDEGFDVDDQVLGNLRAKGANVCLLRAKSDRQISFHSPSNFLSAHIAPMHVTSKSVSNGGHGQWQCPPAPAGKACAGSHPARRAAERRSDRQWHCHCVTVQVPWKCPELRHGAQGQPLSLVSGSVRLTRRRRCVHRDGRQPQPGPAGSSSRGTGQWLSC